MAEPGRVAESLRWGPAERAAFDRCLAVPALAANGGGRFRPAPLRRVIETEIIPRLMLAHREEAWALDEPAIRRPDAADIAEIASLAFSPDAQAALDFAHDLFARGYSLDAVLLEVLAPAARLLGDLWVEDMCTFADVTIGLSRLQQVMRSLGREFELDGDVPVAGRILLAPIPGEQHSFGVSILEGFFRRANWDVSTGGSLAELREAVRDEWFDIVGLSLSCDVLFDRVRPAIRALRKASRNRSIYVMVGGPFFVDHPELAADVGADAAALDAYDALRLAHSQSHLVMARC